MSCLCFLFLFVNIYIYIYTFSFSFFFFFGEGGGVQGFKGLGSSRFGWALGFRVFGVGGFRVLDFQILGFLGF